MPPPSHIGDNPPETPYTFERAKQRCLELLSLKAKGNSKYLYTLCTDTILAAIDPNELTFIKVIGQGTFGVVHVASWRGSVVAAKVIPITQAEL